MIYKEYEGFTKTYVVCRGEGFGVMEAPYIQKEVVFETDSYEEANSKSEELKKANNTEEDLKSSWVPNTYWVNVNTLSHKASLLKKGFEGFTDDEIETMKTSGEYTILKVGEYSFYHKKHPMY